MAIKEDLMNPVTLTSALSELKDAGFDLVRVAASEFFRQMPVPITPFGADLDQKFGPLCEVALRRSLSIAYRGELIRNLNDVSYFPDEPEIRLVFSPEGIYGARVGIENDPSWYVTIPAGWCVEKQTKEVWRCKALILRLMLLPEYRQVYRVAEPFANTIDEAIVDGLSLFLHVFYKAKGLDVEVYRVLRRVLSGVVEDSSKVDALSYELEAHGWLNGGFTHRDENGVMHYLDGRHFDRWLGHTPNRPVDNLVGILSLFERTLWGSVANKKCLTGMGMKVSFTETVMLRQMPPPWEPTSILVAEAVDRAISRKNIDRVAEAAIGHVSYVLAARNDKEKIRRLLSSCNGPYDYAASNVAVAG